MTWFILAVVTVCIAFGWLIGFWCGRIYEGGRATAQILKITEHARRKDGDDG